MCKDNRPRIVPNTIQTLQGRQPVVQIIAHPPKQHPKFCPIKAEMIALELKTPVQSRWFGVRSAVIGPDLKMRVKFDGEAERRFQEIQNWKVARSLRK